MSAKDKAREETAQYVDDLKTGKQKEDVIDDTLDFLVKVSSYAAVGMLASVLTAIYYRSLE